MKIRTVFVAFDDAVFDTAEACRAHEAAHVETRLVGLTIEQVQAAINREDVDLADALEAIGNRIARARREAGDMRRGPKKMNDYERSLSPTKAAEDDGREAFKRGAERDPPEDLQDSLIDAWTLGYDYERAGAARAA